MSELREICFTGMDEETAKSNKGLKCYLCKRSDESSSVIVIDKEPELTELNIQMIQFKNDKNVFHYAMCDECLNLLSALSNPEEAQMNVV